MVFSFLSIYLLGNRNRTGFIMGIIANLFWFSYGLLTESVANMLCSAIITVLQARGWYNWSKSEAEAESNSKSADA